MGEVLDDHGAVSLGLGGGIKGGSERSGSLEHWVLEAVVGGVGSNDEVSNGDRVASDELASVVVEVGFDEAIELSDEGEESLECRLLSLWCSSKSNTGKFALKIGPGVDDWVNVAGLLPVSRVVVAIADTEGAEDSTELGHTVGLAIDLNESLWETATELTTISLSLSCFPAAEVKIGLLRRLTVVLEHLGEGITTSETLEVFPANGGRNDSFLSTLLGAGGGALGTWFSSWCAGVATHLKKFYLIVIKIIALLMS